MESQYRFIPILVLMICMFVALKLMRSREKQKLSAGRPFLVTYVVDGEFKLKDKAKLANLTLAAESLILDGPESLTIAYTEIEEVIVHPLASPSAAMMMVEIKTRGKNLKIICIRFSLFDQFVMGNRFGTAAIGDFLKEKIKLKTALF